ncbi:MAG: aminotransferase class I/II-fold pyridoxal phosphate-dependent enzyme, partial [Acidobacteria bacterium]|nr:aminotransferase class I/II-fold pyridoxal phosphate-dependent enzyme [Acidobacteriota bacterium]
DLARAAASAGAMLLVDEAHALGLFGPTGAGLAEALAAAGALDASAITARVGTLSKALGGIGGFVAASREVCDLVVNRARPFIYTTALPAAACEAARAAVAIVRAEPERGRRVLALAAHLRAALGAKGFDTGGGEAAIVPIIVGEPERALALAAALLDRGIFCPAIRPPTVPPGTSRLRVSLTAGHTEDDVARLVEALAAARDALHFDPA